jgi:hypothetical protein
LGLGLGYKIYKLYFVCLHAICFSSANEILQQIEII